MPLPFNRELDVKLIHCVKKHELLYNPASPHYVSFNERELAWQKIADELNRSASLTKRRWINIRDMMRKKVIERSKKTNSDVPYYYKYESELQFLVTVINNSLLRKSDDGDQVSSEEDQDKDLELTAEEIEDVKPLMVPKKKMCSEFEHCDVNLQNVGVEEESDDPLEVFLLSIATTMRKFSPYYLNQAKTKIFSVVQEFELQQIMDTERPSTERRSNTRTS